MKTLVVALNRERAFIAAYEEGLEPYQIMVATPRSEPPHGLCFDRVVYADGWEFGARSEYLAQRLVRLLAKRPGTPEHGKVTAAALLEALCDPEAPSA